MEHKQNKSTKESEFKIVSRPSNEEIEEEIQESYSKKWKKYPSGDSTEASHKNADSEPMDGPFSEDIVKGENKLNELD